MGRLWGNCIEIPNTHWSSMWMCRLHAVFGPPQPGCWLGHFYSGKHPVNGVELRVVNGSNMATFTSILDQMGQNQPAFLKSVGITPIVSRSSFLKFFSRMTPTLTHTLSSPSFSRLSSRLLPNCLSNILDFPMCAKTVHPIDPGFSQRWKKKFPSDFLDRTRR